MSVYLDVNVLVALFVVDPHNERAERAISGLNDDLFVSILSVAEFSAVIARRVRARDLLASEARTVFSNFDLWCASHTSQVDVDKMDLSAATALIRRLDLPIRTPDALHIAISARIGCALLTFDTKMAKVARALGIRIVKG